MIHIVSIGGNDSAKKRDDRDKVRTLIESGMLSELRELNKKKDSDETE
jgi:hypothetical protein